MTEKDKHLEIRKTPFNCDFMKPVLSNEEYKLFREYGSWMKALYDGVILPLNSKQIEFIDNVNNSIELPEDIYQQIFMKYLRRLEIIKSRSLSNVKIKIEDDRADWKKIRNSRF